MKAQGPAARIQGNKIVLMGEMKGESDRIKAAFAIAKDLAEKIVRPTG
jgi:transcription-repair coupling factor (superfamily II helicase)